MRLDRYEAIDWDPEDDPSGNLAHCQRPSHLGRFAEQVVHEVLTEEPYEIKYPVRTAEFAIVGPDRGRTRLWVVLFDTSWKRGDWLRPVTGWPAEQAERRAWERQGGRLRRDR
jgi:hypothetical protein